MHPSFVDLEAVTSSGLFGSLSPEEVVELRAISSTVNYAKGTTIFDRGAPGDALFAIIQGRVDIRTIWVDGREIKLNMLGPGEVFGEIAAMDGRERTASAVAAIDCRLVQIERDALIEFLGKTPERWLHMMHLLCRRIRWTSNRIEATVFLDITHRLAHQIVVLTQSLGRPTGEGLAISPGFTQDELARMLGVTRESVNKGLQRLANLKVIRYQRSHIVVLDIEGLRALAGDLDG